MGSRRKKDINVEIENGVLLIKGERKFEKETDEKGYRRIERAYGNFLRTFTLPPNVAPEKIRAAYTNACSKSRFRRRKRPNRRRSTSP